jgi:hypothetical protein
MDRGTLPTEACPGRDDWLAVLDERVAEPRRSQWLTHLDHCPHCAEVLATLAGEWSLAGVWPGNDGAPGEATRAFGDRLRALDPRGVATAPVEPEGVPAIPGLCDLVLVGRGGMGVVYRATEEALGRTVAVKLLSGSRTLSPAARQRSLREAQVLARIDHPGVVRLLYTGAIDDVPWTVMEWIDGPTLGRRIAEQALSPREAARIARDLARAIERVHAAGMVHRDIKPDNVLLAAGPTPADPPVPKLIDFGLARPDEPESGITQVSAVVGTPAFMAPEQTGRDPTLGPVGPATDIHGLGATLYCMLTGRAPYHGAATAESLARAAAADYPVLAVLAPTAPADLRTIVEACLRRRPEQRYPSAAALADDLTRFLDAVPIRARPTGPVERVRKWARRHPARALVALLATLSLVGVGGGTAYHVRSLRAAHAEVSVSRDAALAAAALARQSFQRLTDDTAERLLVRGKVLDDLDREHLCRVREEFRAWPLEPDRETGLRFRVAGLRRVATLFQRLEWPEEMLGTIGLALEQIADLEHHGWLTPADEVLRHELLRGERSHLMRQGRFDEAVARTRGEITELEARVGVVPALRPCLAMAHGDLAAIFDGTGRRDEAAAEFGRAIDLFDEVAADPDAAVAPAHLEVSTRYNATISPSLGADTAARDARAARLVARCEALLAADPADATDREAAARGLLMGLRLRADIAANRGAPADALGFLETLVATAGALARRDPANHVITDERVLGACQEFRCHRDLGRPAAAADSLAAAVNLAAAAVAAEPAAFSRLRTLVTALRIQAELCVAVADPEGALDSLRHIVEAAGPWLSGPGGGVEAKGITVDALVETAALLRGMGRAGEATAALEWAVPLATTERQAEIRTEIERLREP